jgi:hypothetical protein
VLISQIFVDNSSSLLEKSDWRAIVQGLMQALIVVKVEVSGKPVV